MKNDFRNNSRSLVDSFNLCEPILKSTGERVGSAKQFSVLINSEIYPKIVRLQRNNSINFECLNRPDQPPKVIINYVTRQFPKNKKI